MFMYVGLDSIEYYPRKVSAANLKHHTRVFEPLGVFWMNSDERS